MIVAKVEPLDGADRVREGRTTRIYGDDVDPTWSTIAQACRAHLRQEGTAAIRLEVSTPTSLMEYPPDA